MPAERKPAQPPAPDRQLVAFVVRHLTCDACDGVYHDADVLVVLHDDDQWALLAVCPHCQHQRPVTAYDRPPYHQLRGRAVVVPAVIATDDVRAWSSYLDDFHGDVHDLLSS